VQNKHGMKLTRFLAKANTPDGLSPTRQTAEATKQEEMHLPPFNMESDEERFGIELSEDCHGRMTLNVRRHCRERSHGEPDLLKDRIEGSKLRAWAQ
jgi:hypothetical protein